MMFKQNFEPAPEENNEELLDPSIEQENADWIQKTKEELDNTAIEITSEQLEPGDPKVLEYEKKLYSYLEMKEKAQAEKIEALRQDLPSAKYDLSSGKVQENLERIFIEKINNPRTDPEEVKILEEALEKEGNLSQEIEELSSDLKMNFSKEYERYQYLKKAGLLPENIEQFEENLKMPSLKLLADVSSKKLIEEIPEGQFADEQEREGITENIKKNTENHLNYIWTSEEIEKSDLSESEQAMLKAMYAKSNKIDPIMVQEFEGQLKYLNEAGVRVEDLESINEGDVIKAELILDKFDAIEDKEGSKFKKAVREVAKKHGKKALYAALILGSLSGTLLEAGTAIAQDIDGTFGLGADEDAKPEKKSADSDGADKEEPEIDREKIITPDMEKEHYDPMNKFMSGFLNQEIEDGDITYKIKYVIGETNKEEVVTSSNYHDYKNALEEIQDRENVKITYHSAELSQEIHNKYLELNDEDRKKINDFFHDKVSKLEVNDEYAEKIEQDKEKEKTEVEPVKEPISEPVPPGPDEKPENVDDDSKQAPDYTNEKEAQQTEVEKEESAKAEVKTEKTGPGGETLSDKEKELIKAENTANPPVFGSEEELIEAENTANPPISKEEITHGLKKDFTLELGKDNVPKQLERVMHMFAVDSMEDLNESDGKFEFSEEQGAKSLNVAANLVELAQGKDTAGLEADDYKEVFEWDEKNNSIDIKDYGKFNELVGELNNHADVLWEKGTLQKGAVAYLDDIKTDTWKDIIDAKGLEEVEVEGHDTVNKDQIKDFDKSKMVEDAEKILSKKHAEALEESKKNVDNLTDQLVNEVSADKYKEAPIEGNENLRVMLEDADGDGTYDYAKLHHVGYPEDTTLYEAAKNVGESDEQLIKRVNAEVIKRHDDLGKVLENVAKANNESFTLKYEITPDAALEAGINIYDRNGISQLDNNKLRIWINSPVPADAPRRAGDIFKFIEDNNLVLDEVKFSEVEQTMSIAEQAFPKEFKRRHALLEIFHGSNGSQPLRDKNLREFFGQEQYRGMEKFFYNNRDINSDGAGGVIITLDRTGIIKGSFDELKIHIDQTGNTNIIRPVGADKDFGKLDNKTLDEINKYIYRYIEKEFPAVESGSAGEGSAAGGATRSAEMANKAATKANASPKTSGTGSEENVIDMRQNPSNVSGEEGVIDMRKNPDEV